MQKLELSLNPHFFYLLALLKTEGVGNKTASVVLQHFEDVQELFTLDRKSLLKIPLITPSIAKNILDKKGIEEAESEIKFIEQYNIIPFTIKDENYPIRLQECNDKPLIIYYKGNGLLSTDKMISIVGTRNSTKYGHLFLEKFIEELSNIKGLTIVSGLAMGIDIKAHELALKYKIPTIGVMGTSMQQIYPNEHKEMAKQMIHCGGLLTEYHSNDRVVPGNFPRRNRIIAGMSDATIVIETKTKGGSVITANIANSYHREVFAVPGRVTDPFSEGCNFLIKTYKANILRDASDLLENMSWSLNKKKNTGVVLEFKFKNEMENEIYQKIKNNPEIGIDNLVLNTEIQSSQLASVLLNLELEGAIESMPGKRYKVVD